MLKNARIEKIGLYYNGHFNHYEIKVQLKTNGGGAILGFPVEKTRKFMSMFDHELDLENGVYMNELVGVPVVIKIDCDNEYGYGGKITAIGNILMTEDELMDIGNEGLK